MWKYRYWRWISYFGQFTYGFRLTMNNEFKGQRFNVGNINSANYTFIIDTTNSNITIDDYSCPSPGGPVFATGEQVLDFYSMKDVPKSHDALVLAGLALAYLLVYYFILYYFVKGKK